MRVEQVEALGFGPLAGSVLELAEGMTVVFGPNEAGKSSWHGALYAGVCGVRRGRGRRSAADEEFESRHRPWGGGPWQVRAVVGLADGRRVELTQDLSARSGTARDHATGREVTSEILTEQTPDASRLLGLDRDAFRAVACIPQTSLLQILERPGQLAEHLQRAAATAGTDATAAEAIKRIEEFLADRGGIIPRTHQATGQGESGSSRGRGRSATGRARSRRHGEPSRGSARGQRASTVR